MCLMMTDHLHSTFSANGPEKDPGAQEIMSGMQMTWDSTMLLTASLTLKAAIFEQRRYISQLRKRWLCTHDRSSDSQQLLHSVAH